MYTQRLLPQCHRARQGQLQLGAEVLLLSPSAPGCQDTRRVGRWRLFSTPRHQLQPRCCSIYRFLPVAEPESCVCCLVCLCQLHPGGIRGRKAAKSMSWTDNARNPASKSWDTPGDPGTFPLSSHQAMRNPSATKEGSKGKRVKLHWRLWCEVRSTQPIAHKGMLGGGGVLKPGLGKFPCQGLASGLALPRTGLVAKRQALERGAALSEQPP